MRIYITYCSAKKDDSLKDTGIKVTLNKLYISPRIKTFMDECVVKRVKWAIFSDFYGVWFPNVKHEWYEKSPDDVSEEEFKLLLRDFDQKLQAYDEIWFYYYPGRFHSLYKRLVKETQLKNRIHLFSHYWEIK
jgi:hypothetical protein